MFDISIDKSKPSILISACLLGKKVRYNGKILDINPKIKLLEEKFNIILVCPEVEGGLLIPRSPSEIKGNKVINKLNQDVTSNFIKGSLIGLEKVKKYNIKYALLKEKSPACGYRYIYDGSFQNKLIEGSGIFTRMLIENKVEIFTLDTIDTLLKSL